MSLRDLHLLWRSTANIAASNRVGRRCSYATTHDENPAQTQSDPTTTIDSFPKTSPPAHNDGHKNDNKAQSKLKPKTTLELDEELRQQMANLSGDGGESGIEYEDGKPVAMKRGVKENMFRYI